ncbi:MAG: hypothetical protein KGJ13_07745 [Patescibacteria group bacterium]|nr:hypothetical protein [Patescibacteria group bacterium]
MTEILSADEAACLMILEKKGEALLPIGKYGPLLERLYVRGFVGRRQTPTGVVDYVMARGGEKAIEDYRHAEAVELIETNNALVKARGLNDDMHAVIHRMAIQLSDIAIASSKMTGDGPAEAAHKWSEVMLKETLRIIANGG